MGVLALELQRHGFKCWIDQEADDLTADGMKRGVGSADGACFTITLLVCATTPLTVF